MAKRDKTISQYHDYRKPAWAPPSWVFGPVWTVLYIIIALSYGYAAYLTYTHVLPTTALALLVLNLAFNVIYSPIQFGLKNRALATLDTLLILATLVWALVETYPYAPWVAIANIPYLLWVCFATVLQLTVYFMNRK